MKGSFLRWLSCAFLSLVMNPVSAESEPTEWVYPIGELLEPLIATPKEAQFSTALHQVQSSGQLGNFNAGVVSYGEYFGLKRWRLDGQRMWQLSIAGALFAQFNLDAESKDLINADYTIGFSASYSDKPLSYRFHLIHQSTHLGDELLLSESAPERVNFSMELMELTGAYQWQEFRLYGVIGYALNIEPQTSNRMAWQLGGEYTGSENQLFSGHGIGGIDLTTVEGDDGNVNTAIKAGLEFGKPGSGNRRIRVMLEGYDGRSPFGQFFDVHIRSYGMGLYLLF